MGIRGALSGPQILSNVSLAADMSFDCGGVAL
jgi:hypothetical protein